MTNEEKAARLRRIVDAPCLTMENREELKRIADELDPPTPEPGTVVWWRDIEGLTEWDTGFVHWSSSDSSKLRILTSLGARVQFHEVQWKPARILAPGEVAVQVPPVSEWPEEAEQLNILYSWPELASSGVSITRAEAEEMER